MRSPTTLRIRRARGRARQQRRVPRPREPGAGTSVGGVLAALDTLPPEQKAALVLVDMEGYPVSEVALMLDCPTGTVKSRCARGRAKLAGARRGRDSMEPPNPARRQNHSSAGCTHVESPGR